MLIDGSTSCRGADGLGGLRIRRSRRSPWGSGDLILTKVSVRSESVESCRWLPLTNDRVPQDFKESLDFRLYET